MTITINADFWKRWWPALVPAIVATYHSVAPQIQTWVAAHPSAAIYISAATVFFATLLKSPLVASAVRQYPDSLSDAISKAKKL